MIPFACRYGVHVTLHNLLGEKVNASSKAVMAVMYITFCNSSFYCTNNKHTGGQFFKMLYWRIIVFVVKHSQPCLVLQQYGASLFKIMYLYY